MKKKFGRFCFVIPVGYIFNINQYHHDKDKTNQQDPSYSVNKVRTGVQQHLSRRVLLSCTCKRQRYEVQQELLLEEVGRTVPQPTPWGVRHGSNRYCSRLSLAEMSDDNLFSFPKKNLSQEKTTAGFVWPRVYLLI